MYTLQLGCFTFYHWHGFPRRFHSYWCQNRQTKKSFTLNRKTFFFFFLLQETELSEFLYPHLTGNPRLVTRSMLIWFSWRQCCWPWSLLLCLVVRSQHLSSSSTSSPLVHWSSQKGDSGAEIGKKAFSYLLCCTAQYSGLCPNTLSLPHWPLTLYYHVGHFAMTKNLQLPQAFSK